jgi:APA family basic amino acid/polyamine antiporter
MAAAARPGPFTTKPTEALLEAAESTRLQRAVGALDLTALGIGAVIGTGIFVIIGEAIGDSGPAIVLSFLLAGVTCVFSALSYAELASAIPVSGSAYTYSYATMGELIAFIIGWDLILEYGLSVAAVAVGWGGYFKELLDSLFGISLPDSIALPPGEGGTVNLPAVLVVAAVTIVLILGVRQSARSNTIMVCIKLVVLLLFIGLGVGHVKSGNFKPFAPNGFDGVVDAAALIFFAYIGFDAVSTASEEAKRPSRDLPIAIIGSLTIATVLYIVVSLVTSGLVPADQLTGNESPLATALDEGAGLSWGADMISFGALVAITSVVLTIMYGQVRIMFSMSRDGLVPAALGQISERTQTPIVLTAIFGFLISVLAALVPLTEIAKLVNIGTLFAFILVNAGVIWLRRTKPDMERGYRVPFVPVVPIIGILLCAFLMKYLEAATWYRFFGWLVVGLVVYAFYGFRHSKLRNEPQTET